MTANGVGQTFLGEDGVIIVDDEMVVMNINAPACRILNVNLTHGDVLDSELFAAGRMRKNLEKAIAATLSSGEGATGILVRLASGDSPPIRMAVSGLYFDDQKVKGLMLTLKEAPKLPVPAFSECFISDSRLLEALPEGVVTINAKFQIASFNRTAEKITGFSRDEALGQYCWDIFRSNLCGGGCLLKEALEKGVENLRRDVEITTKSGERQCILVNTGVLRDDQGLIVGAVETFREHNRAPQTPFLKKKGFSCSEIIGQSWAMKSLFELLPDIAASDANVFITGESGTGKDLFARTIHKNSRRAGKPFVPVNCSALAETLLESELFGHEKAAFTGATKAREGRFEQVKGGTLFLDEIGELKAGLQVKLLRVLDHKSFERVGGTLPIDLDARIISATNRDLASALEDGSFRRDFFYRLRTVPIEIPPLRDREGDIPLLVDYFISKFNPLFNKDIKGIDPRVMDLFNAYHWPGNVRELERVIEHAFVFAKGAFIREENLPQRDAFTSQPVEKKVVAVRGRQPSKGEIIQALQKTRGRKKQAAEDLGISRTSLWRRMKALGIMD
ncbi:MAG: sigma 54-interacting transcriptional regulator [Desulfobacterales bacterium]|nr:sigma 54-interacting transcriptional regulator [Desulfobacterales bacterium]